MAFKQVIGWTGLVPAGELRGLVADAGAGQQHEWIKLDKLTQTFFSQPPYGTVKTFRCVAGEAGYDAHLELDARVGKVTHAGKFFFNMCAPAHPFKGRRSEGLQANLAAGEACLCHEVSLLRADPVGTHLGVQSYAAVHVRQLP